MTFSWFITRDFSKFNLVTIETFQQNEKQRKLEEERELQNEYERSQLLQANAAILMERENDRKAAQIEKKIAEENMRLSTEQRDNLTRMTKEVYTNPPTDDYFAQFNTGTR